MSLRAMGRAARDLLPAVLAAGLLNPLVGHAESPANIKGVLTAWQTSNDTACSNTAVPADDLSSCPNSLNFTITPDLNGLSVTGWVTALTNAKVDTGVIFIVPGISLPTVETIGDKEWAEYNQYIYQAPATLTPAQQQVILDVGVAIANQQYTVAQRNLAIVDFLQQLQDAYPDVAGQNRKPLQFFLDEHMWFIGKFSHGQPGILPLTGNKRNTTVFWREQEYASDMSGIINAAASAGLDPWLAGVRESEYGSKDWNLMGPVMIDLVSRINQSTHNWMKSHIFIGAGGGWGQDFEGVDAMQCPSTAGWQFAVCTGALPFAKLMSQQAAWFAFGDKFMQFGSQAQNYPLDGLTYTGLPGELQDFCIANDVRYLCQNTARPTVTDWDVFLEDDVDGLGFADLIAFMQANTAYPQVTNVVFDGDNSDSLSSFYGLSANGQSANADNTTNGGMALATLFANAANGSFINAETGATLSGPAGSLGTWSGKIFFCATDDTSTIPKDQRFGDPGSTTPAEDLLAGTKPSGTVNTGGLDLFETNYEDFLLSPTPGSGTQITASENAMNWNNWWNWPNVTWPR